MGGKKKKATSLAMEVESQRVINELKARQAQMENQIETLNQSRAGVEAVLRQYTDLYDFAPAGYFTLGRDGIIRQANQVGVNLFGMEYVGVVKQCFQAFVSTEFESAFNTFFEKLLSGEGLEACELQFIKGENETLWARAEATCFDGGDETRIMLTDITERKRMELDLHESESRYRGLIELAVDGILIGSHEGVIIGANSRMLDLTGCSLDELMGMHVSTLFSPNELGDTPLRFDLLKKGETVISMRSILRPDGSVVPVEMHTKMMPDGSYQSIYRDITERIKVEKALQESEERYRTVVSNSPMVTFVLDEEGLFTLSEGQGLGKLGFTPGQVVGLSVFEVYRDYPAVIDAVRYAFEGNEFHLEVVVGDVIFDVFYSPIFDEHGKVIKVTGVAHDITERKLAEVELQYMKEGLEAANHDLQIALAREKQLTHTDFLTGVYSRGYLFEVAEREMNLARRHHHPLSVVMFDIDHFKQVNDIFGHIVGDEILQHVAQIAKDQLRSSDMLGRYGGEEFVAVLPVTNMHQAHLLAERVRKNVEALRLPTEKGDASVTLSIGIVEMSHAVQPESVEDVIRRADQLMYGAKQAGRNCIMSDLERILSG